MALSETTKAHAGATCAKDEQSELVEFEPKDDDSQDAINCDTEAITKEEEWITKRKTELTTTRQIETRVKRQVKLKDGKVIEDSGPIVSTNTTEDTDKQETETTEKRDHGLPQDQLDGNGKLNDVSALEAGTAAKDIELAQLKALEPSSGVTMVRKMVPRPADGLVRQTDDKRVISHEETKDYHEVEDVKHLGDVTDETYVSAVRDGVEDLEAALCSPASQQQLVPLGPRLIANTSKSRKTIDSEDTQKRCLAQVDGTLVTESNRTTTHELIVDEELPEDSAVNDSLDILKTTAASQRYFKQRDEQHVDLVADGKVVGTEMRYAAETMQMDKEGSLERPGDWDSLSDRMRKLRRSQQQKVMLQQQREVALLADRKDALTKRPLDFDREEETRKGETMKWLESHFGSESTASNDSRDDDGEVEPTKKSYFNVTIKSQSQMPSQAPASQPQQQPQTLPRSAAHGAAERQTTLAGGGVTLERKYAKESATRSKYFQGISNWDERQEMPSNHFSSQAFRDDLQETIKRNGLKKKISAAGSGAGEPGNDRYVSREDILQQKRQSLSSQFLAKSARGSRITLDALDTIPVPRAHTSSHPIGGAAPTPRNEEPSQKRVAYGQTPIHSQGYDHHIGTGRALKNVSNGVASARALETPDYNYSKPSTVELIGSTKNLGRPTVPQRRRAIEKKLSEQQKHVLPLKTAPLPMSQLEPPPDYSPPPRSRSSSPQVDYVLAPTPTRKPQQRTRFAPTSSYPPSHNGGTSTGTGTGTGTGTATGTLRPTKTPVSASTSNISSASTNKQSKMGQVLGNSLRKLVNKIRSASAERKFRMKSSASKSREQSPSTGVGAAAGTGATSTADRNLTTYQQYNVIDGHIGGGQTGGRSSSSSHQSETESEQREREPIKAEPRSFPGHQSTLKSFKRAESADPHIDHVTSPPQRYYLGEDPYSSTLYGKENIYERQAFGGRHRKRSTEPRYENSVERAQDENDYYAPRTGPAVGSGVGPGRTSTTHTLGRYQKHGQRFTGSTPNLSLQPEYRSVQTLPRKLHEHSQYRTHQPLSQRGVAQQDQRQSVEPDKRPYLGALTPSQQQQQQLQQQPPFKGPAKPARTYARVLNRSKSFNIHGMNGSNDPSPIYIEKLTKNNYNNNNNSSSSYGLQQQSQHRQQPAHYYGGNLQASQAYKSNPHLFSSSKDNSLKSGLKSPSIVNLISRSQKDLTKITGNDDDLYQSGGQRDNSRRRGSEHEDKKQLYLRGLHQQAPDLYRAIHGDEEQGRSSKYPLQHKYSLDSSGPVSIEFNKDTASIMRQSIASGSNDGYGESTLMADKRPIMYTDQGQGRRSSGPGATTIIEVRSAFGPRK
ncbi:uncharacterized protein LOC115627113 [Scaptodrosophila lebanonensis]|uniref:Uncharacterized protein LOC115627113 n=1 Tax=Drosophila lebanonensis TaxID=7225 RepID=A0A6J2TR68_DROLE|nr:uncharacterized protein LOC115627113 [Scaptodrosophila lebanonensis]